MSGVIHLMEQRRAYNKESTAIDGLMVGEEHQLLHSNLLSQEDKICKMPEVPTAETKQKASSSTVAKVENKNETGSGSKEMGIEEIVKELRIVKRQNTITHWLLSAMIFLTATWQLSEVSLILKVKNKLSHPFKSIGNMIKSAILGGNSNVFNSVGNNKKSLDIEPSPLPVLKIPELRRMDLPILDLNGGGDD